MVPGNHYGFIPAFLQLLIASLTPSLGGSIIQKNPTNVKLSSIKLDDILDGR